MNRNDIELLKDSTRVTASFEAVVIEVAEIHWLQPHQPFAVWHPVVVLSPESTPEYIESARRALLNRKRFFAVCSECDLRHAKGHMHSPGLCMSCAENSHGIVY